MRLAALCLILGMLAGASLTKYYWPTETVRTETKDVVHKDVVTVVKIVKDPNGDTTTTTTTTDHSTIVDDKTASIPVSKPVPQWLVSGSIQAPELGLKPVYGLQVQRRILGPVFIGMQANLNHEVGLTVGMEF